MSWLQHAPPLTQGDVRELQSELLKLYPQMVMFPRSYHFHNLGEEVGKPQFIESMVEHFQPRISSSSKFGYRSGNAIAVRVPWPEEIDSGNPQRLIGRPYRSPYQDSPQVFRRFGRTVYFSPHSAICYAGVILDIPGTLIAHDTVTAPNIRVLAECNGFGVEIPYDTEDTEVVAFTKSVMSIINRLGTRSHCYYDCVTGEALFILPGQPFSKSFMKQCALSPNLYMQLQHGTIRGHPVAIGPTPAQSRKWRREAGFGDDPSLRNPRTISWPEYSEIRRTEMKMYSDEVQSEISRLTEEAFIHYMREHGLYENVHDRYLQG